MEGTETLLMVLVLLGIIYLNASTTGASTIHNDASDAAGEEAGACGPFGGGQLEAIACIDT